MESKFQIKNHLLQVAYFQLRDQTSPKTAVKLKTCNSKPITSHIINVTKNVYRKRNQAEPYF